MNSKSLKLSPLSFSRLIANAGHAAAADGPSVPGRVKEVISWQCLECSSLHEYEGEAKDCCAESPEDRMVCPVCLCSDNVDYQSAADCCLWKDIDAPTRWRIAAAVERGAEWAEAIQGSLQ